jgi:transcriptional regulator with XRE-family HTH domain
MDLSNKARREELKHFLRSRRERLSPADYGFAEGTRRRTRGLRRDEIALLAGIGNSTYTFLEQGRDINISAGVVARLADVFKLNPQEKRHFYRLTIGDLPRPGAPTESLSESIGDILQHLQPLPAAVLNHRFELIAFNDAARIVFRYPEDAVAQRYNIVERLVTDAARRSLFSELPVHMRDLLGYFRLSYARFPDDEALVKLVSNLESQSEEFRRFWEQCEVIDADYANTVIRMTHPQIGELSGRLSFFELFGCNLSLSVYVPLAGTDTKSKIARALVEQGFPVNASATVTGSSELMLLRSES